MSKTSFRGHEIEYKNGEYVFSDTNDSVSTTWEERPCGSCGERSTWEGHDGCMGTLPSVMNACCGHGNINEAYVQFNDGAIVRGSVAEEVTEILKMQRGVKNG